MTDTESRIPHHQEKQQELCLMLEKNRSLSVLYINCSGINRMEATCGRKAYLEIIKNINDIIYDMKGKFIRSQDILLCNDSAHEEFVIFLSEKRGEKSYWPSDLESLCKRVAEFLNRSIFPITFQYLRGSPKISVGYAIIIHNPLIRPERLISKLISDAKLMADYYEFRRLMRYKEKLQELILKEMIVTVYQPIVNFVSNQVIAFEALSRGPAGTELENPYILFDAAKETELLFELDRLCRKKAFENSRGIKPEHKLFINCLPATVLDPEFKDVYLKSLLDDLKLSPCNIVFEITEREAIENYERFNESVRYYTNLGFSIAVDDAGAGFSSLETVIELKPQFIKLDLSVVRNIENNILKQELVKAIQTLALSMNSLVIAEGIETAEELNTLKQLGITTGQGFFFARPGPPFPEILLNRL